MAFEIRAVTPGEIDELIQTDRRSFGQSMAKNRTSPGAGPRPSSTRTCVAFEDGSMVGVSRAYSFELTLPGRATVPAAAVSWVGVLPFAPSARRAHPDDAGAARRRAANAREPAAILTASESVIYGRFGYGVATWRLGLSVDRSAHGSPRPIADAGRIRMVARDEAEKVLPTVYDQIRRERPAW